MSVESIIAVLAFGTMGAVVLFGYLSATRTQERLESNKRKSTLAADAPDTLPAGKKPVDT